MRRLFDFVPPWRTALAVLVLQIVLGLVDRAVGVRVLLPLLDLEVLLVLFGGMPGAFLATASMLISVTVVVSEVFGYKHVLFSIPELVNNVPYFPWQVQVAVYLAALIGLALLIGIPLASRFERRRYPTPARVAWRPVAGICALILVAYAGKFLTHRDLVGSNFLTTRDEAWFVARTLLVTDFSKPFAPLPRLEGADAIDAAAARREDIIVVVVESLGEFKDAAFQQRLDAVFATPAVTQRYDVHQGLHPFNGSTIHGEFRELCDVELRSVFFKAAPKGCLPERLAALGYHTEAYHGNDARFYRRLTWYPEIGIQDIIDLGKLPNAKASHCGGIWDAYCDIDLLALAGHRPPGGPPRLTYVLTINSHLPAQPMTRGKADLPGCREHYADNVCTHLENEQRVLNAIADFAVARAPATVLIAGDHAPPFSLEGERALFLPTSVPYYLLQSK